jgi:hypothetical protein
MSPTSTVKGSGASSNFGAPDASRAFFPFLSLPRDLRGPGGVTPQAFSRDY